MGATCKCPCASSCALYEAANMLGGKWKISILCTIMADGPSRYNTIQKKSCGISNTVLSKMLKELEQDGLLERTEYLEVPIRVEYSLTEKARALEPILKDLIKWSRQYS